MKSQKIKKVRNTLPPSIFSVSRFSPAIRASLAYYFFFVLLHTYTTNKNRVKSRVGRWCCDNMVALFLTARGGVGCRWLSLVMPGKELNTKSKRKMGEQISEVGE